MASAKAEDLAVYDLNGDNAINIIHLAYVNRLTAAEGDSTVLSTAPHGDRQVLAGTVTMEDDQNNRTTHPFDYTPPENVHAIGEGADGGTVISILMRFRENFAKRT